MERTPLTLAALASAAVPGLDPASVEGVAGAPGGRYDVALVQDTQHRRWVVRGPRTDAASAALDQVQPMLVALARRVSFAVPAAKGSVRSRRAGSAVVYPYIPGRTLDLTAMPAGAGIAADLGRAIAALHNLSPEVYEEAGVATYESEAYRARRLTEVDRAASAGRVPGTLLQRWERALEDVSLWRFAPVPTHGALSGEHVLVTFEDEQDPATGRVRGLLGWEHAQVADPADDFAQIVLSCPSAAQDTLFEAYAHARVERPDQHLRTRARLSGELALSRRLVRAIAEDHPVLVEQLSAQLHRLDEQVHVEDEASDDYRLSSLPPVAPRRTPPPPPELDMEAENTDEVVIFGGRGLEGSGDGSSGETAALGDGWRASRETHSHAADLDAAEPDTPAPDTPDPDTADPDTADLDAAEPDTADAAPRS